MYFAGLDEYNENTGQSPGRSKFSEAIFVSTCILAVCSIVTTAVAASLFRGNQIPYTTSVSICQGLILTVSSISFLYLGFYLVAARKNNEVGKQRPPVRPEHAACFITTRIASVLWVGTIIASLVICFDKDVCPESVLLCRLTKLDVVVSIAAFLSSGIILWCLEICTHPFKTPRCLRIRPQSVYGIITIDDLLERSVSRACNRGSCNPNCEKGFSGLEVLELLDKELPVISLGQPWTTRTSSLKNQNPRVPGVFPADGNRDKRASDSSISTWSGTTDLSGYSGTTIVDPQRPRRAIPSSAIGSSTKRSPLSTMRYADYPNIAIQPIDRYNPIPKIPVPHIPPSHQWNLYHPRPFVIYHDLPLPAGHICPCPLRPVANPPSHAFERRPSAMVWPLSVRTVGPLLMPPKLSPPKALPREVCYSPPELPPTPTKLVRKKTVDVKVPGAFPLQIDFEIDDDKQGGDGRKSETFCEGEGEVGRFSGNKMETYYNRGLGDTGGGRKEQGKGDGDREKTQQL